MNKIETDEQALAAADEIVTLTNNITRIKSELEAELQDVRSRYAPQMELIEGRVKELTKLLSTYTTRKGVAARLFKDGKTAYSPLAAFGWRDSAPTIRPLDTKAKLEDVALDLQERGLLQYIVLPEPKPTLNRAGILGAGMDASQLAGLGLRLVTKSTFFVDLRDREVTRETTVKA